MKNYERLGYYFSSYLRFRGEEDMEFFNSSSFERLFLAVHAVDNGLFQLPKGKRFYPRVLYMTNEDLCNLGLCDDIFSLLSAPFILERRILDKPTIFAHVWNDYYIPLEWFLKNRKKTSFTTISLSPDEEGSLGTLFTPKNWRNYFALCVRTFAQMNFYDAMEYLISGMK